MKKLVFLTVLTVAGCATAPKPWYRVDNRPIDSQQISVDETVCQGELQKARMAANPNSLGLLSRLRAQDDVFVGCMAERGYLR